MMLQGMQKKVEEEGKKEKELYDKFMCYCQSGGTDLSASIDTAEDKVPAVGSDIKAAEGKVVQSKEDLKQAQVDRDAAKAAIKEATAIREKEASAYAAYKADADTNTQAIAKAVLALEKGMGSSFLQSQASAVQTLLRLAKSSEDLSEDEHQQLVAFLSASQSSGYAPASGGILGILKQMGGTMAEGLAEATKTEQEAIKSCRDLVRAKEKELKALTETIESKTQDIGELGIELVQMKEDLSDTQKALLEDQKFIKELKKSCGTKSDEWAERQRTRAEELVALADTIKLLNDDDALDLFKKTLPGASSLLQFSVSAKEIRARALHAMRGARQSALKQDKAGLDLLTLALAGKKAMNQGGFAEVVKMCDEMVEVLKKEQQDDNHKKEYCAGQFGLAEDKKKGLERTIAKETNAIATTKDAIATTIEEIAALETGIRKLDRSVAEATEQRKQENAEYKELMSSDGQAKELLAFAKNRLNKFYNPKMYKEDKSAPSFVQVVAAKKDAPSPPPETWDAYSKKSGESNSVISMMDLLLKDLEKEMTEAKAEEQEAQADYETMMKESADKRTTDSKSLTEKSSAKADMETALEEHKEHLVSGSKELMATDKYIHNLHAECDWLIQYFDVRKEARTDEIDAITKAKAVLNGADYSLVQTKAHSFLLRGAPAAAAF